MAASHGRDGSGGLWRTLRTGLRRAPPEDGEQAPPGGELPRFFLLFLLLFGVGMILVSLVGDQGLIAYYHLQREARSLRADVARLETRRHELIREIDALRDDPAYIEHLARKRLGLVQPDETVLQLPLPGRRP